MASPHLIPFTSETARAAQQKAQEVLRVKHAVKKLDSLKRGKNLPSISRQTAIVARDALDRVRRLENRLARGGRPRNDGIAPGFAPPQPGRTPDNLFDDLPTPTLARQSHPPAKIPAPGPDPSPPHPGGTPAGNRA